MKIALASARFIDLDIPFNLSQIEKYMKEAKTSGAELICFGESFLQGFECLTWDYQKDKNTALTLTSPELSKLCQLTSEIGIDLMTGFIERDKDKLFSSCAFFKKGQLFHLYRRISKGWKEFWHTDTHYQEGTSVKPFIYGNRKCLIALCGDLWDYPEKFCLGADLLFWPVFIDIPLDDWNKTDLRLYTKQAEKVCTNVLYINSVSNGIEPAFGGCYYFSEGKIKASLPSGKEGLLIVDVS